MLTSRITNEDNLILKVFALVGLLTLKLLTLDFVFVVIIEL